MILATNFFSLVLFWSQLVLPVLMIILPIWMGSRIGAWYRVKFSTINHIPLGSVVGAALGLFAFMLAFTFQITSSRFQDRKQLLLDDVESIRTVYLQAGLLNDSVRIPVRKLVIEYTELRIKASNTFSIDQLKGRSNQIHASLWSQAEALAREDRNSEIFALFISSVNEMIAIHHRREEIALHYHIPPIILGVLYFISFFSMLILGIQFGVSGRGNMKINLLLAVIFSAVMWLIFALDKPEAGLIRVNQGPLHELLKDIKSMT